MSNPANVRIEGPLAGLVPGFRGRLAASGYSPGSAAHQLQLLAQLSRWMTERGLAVHDLSPEMIDEFFRCRRGSHSNLVTVRSLAGFLDFLADLDVDRAPGISVPAPVWEEVLGPFGRYLADERGLAPTTVQNYLNQARPFLRWRTARMGEDLSTLSVNEVISFLLVRGTQESVGSIRVAVTALRVLLRWMYLVGITEESLAEGLTPVTYSAFGSLPKALSPVHVHALVSQTAAAPVTPYRDRALVLVLSRLGLRSREVADLRLDDLHWRTGTVVVSGKRGNMDTMPLPADVGAAIAGYLEHERPPADDRHLFLQANAPHAPLGRTGVSAVISRLGQRAGIGSHVGAHRLRHSVATRVLETGGTLTEAAQLLRHTTPAATVIYARVDLQALATVAREWPTSGASASAASTPWRA